MTLHTKRLLSPRVSFITPRGGKNPRYSYHRSLAEPQSRSGLCWRREKYCPCRESKRGRRACSSSLCRLRSHLLIQTRHLQRAAQITPTFQRGITNIWYEVSPKTFYFPNIDIAKFFYFSFQNYIVQMVAVTADTHLEPFFLNGLL
jgi:hypothetical protein